MTECLIFNHCERERQYNLAFRKITGKGCEAGLIQIPYTIQHQCLQIWQGEDALYKAA